MAQKNRLSIEKRIEAVWPLQRFQPTPAWEFRRDSSHANLRGK
ncbi:MAG: hypothetical protein WAR81_11385 [Pseudomonadales bacterium]